MAESAFRHPACCHLLGEGRIDSVKNGLAGRGGCKSFAKIE
jgi:hypothetical protein